MNIAIVGTGYVGLVSGTCFAEIGHQVVCLDVDARKIEMLCQGCSPLYEPGLEELVRKNVRSGRLHFSTDYKSLESAEVIFLAVGTPARPDGSSDLQYLFNAAREVAGRMAEEAVVVIKSTVPVGTGDEIGKLIGEVGAKRFHLVSNPEFLREGRAIEDFMRPDRVILGCSDKVAEQVMHEVYRPLVRQGNPILCMSMLSAEMAKYAANCFLATKISFINEMARLCDKSGADIEEVRMGIAGDHRIGTHNLYPGPGYGGSCFPKDVQAIFHTAAKWGVTLKLLRATDEVNREQKTLMYGKMRERFQSDLKGKKFAFWGVAFKANTDDVRETSAEDMALALVRAGAEVLFYDPEAADNYLMMMDKHSECQGKLHRCEDMYSCLDDCDGLVVMTEWREFQRPDFGQIHRRLRTPVIFDARNLFDTQEALRAGFDYYAVGKRIEQEQR